MAARKIKTAIVGTGFVVDYYMHTIRKYPNLELVGITEKIRERGEKFAQHYNVPFYETLDELLDKSGAEIIINLTDPYSHFEISKACLEKGKHVYSEKPTCPDFNHSKELTRLADKNDLQIVTAPCSLLSPTAQTLWKTVRDNKIGKVRLVYAEMDDGPVHFMGPDKWRSKLGVPWPYENEFSVGCALEHLGYALTWVTAFFGPVKHVTAFSSCLTPQKLSFIEPTETPDFTVACLEHESGVITRITGGIMAPMDRSLRIVGDKGLLSIRDFWDNYSPVKANYYTSLKLKAERKEFINDNWLLRKVFGLDAKTIPLINNAKRKFSLRPEKIKMDYILGINDLASAILHDDEPVLSKSFCLHINELTLKIQNSLDAGKVVLETTFDHEEMLRRNFKEEPFLSSTYVPEVFQKAGVKESPAVPK